MMLDLTTLSYVVLEVVANLCMCLIYIYMQKNWCMMDLACWSNVFMEPIQPLKFVFSY